MKSFGIYKPYLIFHQIYSTQLILCFEVVVHNKNVFLGVIAISYIVCVYEIFIYKYESLASKQYTQKFTIQ